MGVAFELMTFSTNGKRTFLCHLNRLILYVIQFILFINTPDLVLLD